MTRIAITSVVDSLESCGSRVGGRTVVVRFSGCNLWDGNPLRRENGSAACAFFCDASFAKGTPMEEYTLLALMNDAWEPPAKEHPKGARERYCTLTGGEPLEQLPLPLVQALKADGWFVTVETNGTILSRAASEADWLVVSPKRGAPLVEGLRANELRVALPGNGGPHEAWSDGDLEALAERFPHAALFVTPEDILLDPTILPAPTLLRDGGVEDEEQNALLQLQFSQNLSRCVGFVRTHPRWRLAPEVGKLIGTP